MKFICAILAGLAWYTHDFALLCLACGIYFLFK